MTRAISVIIGGVETQLSTLGALVAHLGWGMAAIESFAERSPGQHGDTWAGFNLGPRIGHLVFKSVTGELDDLYALREDLLSLFSPLSSEIILKFGASGTLDERRFSTHLVGGLEGEWDVQGWGVQKFEVSLKASDPTCYDPTGEAWTFSLGGGEDGFFVPYDVPYAMGASVINQTQVITYPGGWLSYPLIRITGPITDPVITNDGTGDVLDFAGITIAAGHWYEIDCRYGQKTVVDEAGTNRIAELTAASDLATFHIAPDPELADGINSIRVSGSAVDASTKIEITYFVRYLGV